MEQAEADERERLMAQADRLLRFARSVAAVTVGTDSLLGREARAIVAACEGKE